jgi:hypothetical protein
MSEWRKRETTSQPDQCHEQTNQLSAFRAIFIKKILTAVGTGEVVSTYKSEKPSGKVYRHFLLRLSNNKAEKNSKES